MGNRKKIYCHNCVKTAEGERVESYLKGDSSYETFKCPTCGYRDTHILTKADVAVRRRSGVRSTIHGVNPYESHPRCPGCRLPALASLIGRGNTKVGYNACSVCGLPRP